MSLDLSHKAKILGFVDLSDDAFMISDAETADYFLFDLKRGEWFAIEPPRSYIWQFVVGLLDGRSIFVEGFIYVQMVVLLLLSLLMRMIHIA